VEAAAGLGPNDPVKPVARMVAGLSADTMLVGHLPFMARLAGRLVTGDEHEEVVAFVPGTVLCLEPAAGDRWCVAWMVRPELATGGQRPQLVNARGMGLQVAAATRADGDQLLRITAPGRLPAWQFGEGSRLFASAQVDVQTARTA
jgi:hypothetical protein